MKVGIITFHRAKNYGAVLQAYALTKHMERIFPSIDVEIIDYRCKYIEDFYNPFVMQRGVRNRIKSSIYIPNLLARNMVFNRFLKRHIRLSTKVYRGQINGNVYDKIITGSDMVFHWHTTNDGEFFDDNYFLSFEEKKEKKFSYAASFGFDTLPGKYYDYYQKKLRSFEQISIREESGIAIVQNLTGKNGICNIDPTLLLSSFEWSALEKKPEEKDYVLVYEVGTLSESMIEHAESIAKKNKQRVIYLLSEYPKLSKKKDKNVFFGYSPEEFLGWFRNACCVITNSFHGTVFSILYHKPMLVEIDTWTLNNRAYELMKKLNLCSRILGECDMWDIIDWKNVDSILENERKKANEYLFRVVGLRDE